MDKQRQFLNIGRHSTDQDGEGWYWVLVNETPFTVWAKSERDAREKLDLTATEIICGREVYKDEAFFWFHGDGIHEVE